MALFLIAQIDGRTVAIESDRVESVVDLDVIVPVPCAERHVRGLAALRSRVVTVIDPRAALGLAGSSTGPKAGTRAVITTVDGHHYAVLVDVLDDIAQFDLAPLSAAILLDQSWRSIGCGIVERDSEPILAIALDRLILGATSPVA